MCCMVAVPACKNANCTASKRLEGGAVSRLCDDPREAHIPRRQPRAVVCSRKSQPIGHTQHSGQQEPFRPRANISSGENSPKQVARSATALQAELRQQPPRLISARESQEPGPRISNRAGQPPVDLLPRQRHAAVHGAVPAAACVATGVVIGRADPRASRMQPVAP